MGVCLLALCSCSEDEGTGTAPAEQQEDVYINLRINVPGGETARTRALTPANESAIGNLQVLVFNAVDQFKYKAEIGTLDDAASGTIYVRLRRSTNAEQYHLVLLANAAELNPTANQAKKETLTQATFTVGKTGYPHDAGTPLPMWGESIPQVIDSDTDFGTINIYRAVARVDVGVAFAKTGEGETIPDQPVAQGLANFKLTGVQVYNSLDKGYVAPLDGYGTISIPEAAAVHTPNAYIDYSISGGKQTDHEIYLAEVNNHNDDQGKTVKAMANRCCLVVEGQYAADEAGVETARKTYYRIDFLDDGITDAKLTDILRNHRYTFNITSVYGPGYDKPQDAFENQPFNISVNVQHWDQGLEYSDYDGQYNFQCSAKAVSLAYAAGSQAKIGARSNVAVADWQFENEGEWDGALSVTLPDVDDVTATTGYITFRALKQGPFSADVRLKIKNLSITFKVTQTDGAYLSPDGVILQGWQQTNGGDEKDIPADLNTTDPKPGAEGVTDGGRGNTGTVTSGDAQVVEY